MKTVELESMTPQEKLELIIYFYNSYYDTGQDSSVFGKEFFEVVSALSVKEIPIELNYLVDFIDGIKVCFSPERDFSIILNAIKNLSDEEGLLVGYKREGKNEIEIFEDEQEVMELINDEGNCEVKIFNVWQSDAPFEMSLEEFIQDNDLSEEKTLENLKEEGVLLYNWKTKEFDDNYQEFFHENYKNENYKTKAENNVIKTIAEEEGNHLATVIVGDNGYFYLSSEYHFVNRDGYVVYKHTKQLHEDYLV